MKVTKPESDASDLEVQFWEANGGDGGAALKIPAEKIATYEWSSKWDWKPGDQVSYSVARNNHTAMNW